MSIVHDVIRAISTKLPSLKTLEAVLKAVDANIKIRTGASFSDYREFASAGMALALKGRAFFARGAVAAAAALVQGLAAVQGLAPKSLIQKNAEPFSDFTHRGVDTLD